MHGHQEFERQNNSSMVPYIIPFFSIIIQRLTLTYNLINSLVSKHNVTQPSLIYRKYLCLHSPTIPASVVTLMSSVSGYLRNVNALSKNLASSSGVHLMEGSSFVHQLFGNQSYIIQTYLGYV